MRISKLECKRKLYSCFMAHSSIVNRVVHIMLLLHCDQERGASGKQRRETAAKTLVHNDEQSG